MNRLGGGKIFDRGCKILDLGFTKRNQIFCYYRKTGVGRPKATGSVHET